MGYIKNLIEFFTRDKSGEDRGAGLMILTRFVVGIVMLLLLFCCIFVSVRGYFPQNLYYLGGVAVLALTMVLSFHIKYADIVLLIFMVTVYVISFFISPIFGWRNSFDNFLFVALMIFWYDSSKSVKLKLLYSAITTGFICALELSTRPGEARVSSLSFDYRFLLIMNTLGFCACVCSVAYILCKDNVNDERKLILYNEKLKQMAGVDPLTGLMNRRQIGEKFEELAKERDTSITIAIGDIDFFKKVNDTRGHDCGDYVLKTLAAVFRDYMKDKGYASRWGGEEFVFVFSGYNGDDAYPMLEQLRKDIEKYQFEFFGHSFNITMTFGMEEYSPRFGTEEAIKKADEKLYIGKENGRNQVVF
ncbi:MAG: GGDEF domain-containing protein [Lachnospiraceae bacterium]|nr:GGDEF domain-containing protein [Lachnospiraceae bacterium]